jgi:transcriptional regulator with XRE-family HTH domain
MNRRRTVERWLELREREGLTYQELSERSGIAASTLAGWAWRLRKERSGQPAAAFVELRLGLLDGGSDDRLELVLRNERRLLFAEKVDPEVIARLAARLERC